MTDASPAKWHLAHTTWFFETFVLSRFLPDYRVYDPAFSYLFNSYYVQAGERHCRAQRGLVTRPTVAEVYEYRRVINEAMTELFEYIEEATTHSDTGTIGRDTISSTETPPNTSAAAPSLLGDSFDDLLSTITIGLHHEQQHQELLLTDLKYLFYANPIHPAYDTSPIVGALPIVTAKSHDTPTWIDIPAGVAEIGHAGDGFAYDNETPRHPHYLAPARIATQLVTNGEYLRFMEDGGYQRPELWLSAGWATVQEQHWEAPLYWECDSQTSTGWRTFTLAGLQPLESDNPLCHVSFYEADAYARWLSTHISGARLATEFEWETVAPTPDDDSDPSYANGDHGARDPDGWYGAVWQWTSSPYVGYPGYRPALGAIGEYNGKFMADQWVLRGSSIATPPGHARRTYRNFFPADARWQFTGIRIATDV